MGAATKLLVTCVGTHTALSHVSVDAVSIGEHTDMKTHPVVKQPSVHENDQEKDIPLLQ